MKEKNILLIDDDLLTHKNFARIFEDTSYVLDFAIDSIEGLEKVKKRDYDLVFLDIIMPDLNNRQSQTAGIDFLKIIQKLKPYLPVIMITVVDMAIPAVEAIKAGAKDYIIKDSITKDGLIQKTEEVLKGDQYPIKKLISRGESLELEFKATMRWNVKKNKADKDIEFSWLKTIAAFMNTDGGTLLIGVMDDGAILGIAADNFQNDDKYLLHFNNLIKQHIGFEFSKFIKCEMIPVEGKKIFLVECEKSKKPVFLKKINDDEEFYIRVGPSSRKLSISKMLDYLENNRSYFFEKDS